MRHILFVCSVLFVFCVPTLCAPDAARAQNSYTCLDLGQLEWFGTYFPTFPTGVNSAGEVVGAAMTESLNAFHWDPNRLMTSLTPEGSAASYAYDINEAGVAVGHVDGLPVQFSGEGAGRLRLLPDSIGGVAVAINNQEQAAGYTFDADFRPEAVLWEGRGQVRSMGASGKAGSWAFALNDAGQALGYSVVYRDEHYQKGFYFLWDRKQGALPLPMGTYDYIRPTALNAAGTVVGYTTLAVPGLYWYDVPLIWVKGRLTTPRIPGISISLNDINDAGQIVGRTSLAPHGYLTGFVYQEGRTRLLESLIPFAPDAPRFFTPTGISRDGKIVGYGYPTPSSPVHSYLLTPSERVLPHPAEVTERLAITPLELHYEHFPADFTQQVKIRNTGRLPIAGPLYLIPENVQGNLLLDARDGFVVSAEPKGEAYIQVDIGPDNRLAAGEAVTTTLHFAGYRVIKGASVRYTPRVLAGPGRP